MTRSLTKTKSVATERTNSGKWFEETLSDGLEKAKREKDKRYSAAKAAQTADLTTSVPEAVAGIVDPPGAAAIKLLRRPAEDDAWVLGTIEKGLVDPTVLRRFAEDDAWVLEAIEQGLIDPKAVMERAAIVPGVMAHELDDARSLLRESFLPEFNRVRVMPKPEVESALEDEVPQETAPRMR